MNDNDYFDAAAGLTRRQWRAIQRLLPKVHRELNSDRLFFAMNPHREFLVRPVFKNELRLARVTMEELEADHVAVRRLSPTARHRRFFNISDDAPAATIDWGEEFCRQVYEALGQPKLQAEAHWDMTDNIIDRIFPKEAAP